MSIKWFLTTSLSPTLLRSALNLPLYNTSTSDFELIKSIFFQMMMHQQLLVFSKLCYIVIKILLNVTTKQTIWPLFIYWYLCHVWLINPPIKGLISSILFDIRFATFFLPQYFNSKSSLFSLFLRSCW